MIIGAHSIIYSTNPEADRAFFRDILGLPHVDVGGGWLIFGLPPAEVAVHDAESDGKHELYLMCRDVEAFIQQVGARGIETSEVQDQGWGLVTEVTLPGGGKLGVYQPRHARPESASAASSGRVAKKKAPAKKQTAARKLMKVNKAAPAKKKVAKKKKKGR